MRRLLLALLLLALPAGAQFGRFNFPPSGGGAGVTGLTTADGGTAIGDNVVIRGDGPTGIQGSLATLSDAGLLAIVQAASADDKFRLNPATPAFQLASDAQACFFSDPDIGSGSGDVGFKRGAAGRIDFTNCGAGVGAVRIGNLDFTTNTIGSTNANGNIAMDPNGTGVVQLVDGEIEFTGAGGPRLTRSGSFLHVGVNSGPLVGGDGTSASGLRLGNLGSVEWSSGNPTGTGSATTLTRSSEGVVKLDDALRLDPISAPPVTCGGANTQGVIYDDDSVALCWCDGTAWQKLGGGGTCA